MAMASEGEGTITSRHFDRIDVKPKKSLRQRDRSIGDDGSDDDDDDEEDSDKPFPVASVTSTWGGGVILAACILSCTSCITRTSSSALT